MAEPQDDLLSGYTGTHAKKRSAASIANKKPAGFVKSFALSFGAIVVVGLAGMAFFFGLPGDRNGLKGRWESTCRATITQYMNVDMPTGSEETMLQRCYDLTRQLMKQYSNHTCKELVEEASMNATRAKAAWSSYKIDKATYFPTDRPVSKEKKAYYTPQDRYSGPFSVLAVRLDAECR